MNEREEIFRMAKVYEKSSYTYRIIFDGDTEASQKFYKQIGTTSLSTGAHVLCAKVSGTWIIIGKVS